MSEAEGNSLKPKRLHWIAALGLLSVQCAWTLVLICRLRLDLITVLYYYLFVYGGTSSGIALLIAWKAQHGILRVVRKAAIWTCVALTMLLPAFFVGGVVARIDMSASLRRGEAIYAEALAFKERTGRCPESLGELERDVGSRLPRPVLDTGFYYSTNGDQCSITVFTNGPRINTYRPERGSWSGTLLHILEFQAERRRRRHQQQEP